MTQDKIAQLGNWNPQLLREFRGRLKSRSLIAAIALSLIIQGLILLLFFDNYRDVSDWVDLWETLMWVIPYLLFSIGSYYIVSNIVQEEKTGTLNFIRLSPRPAWQILLGKVVGVPILPLIAIGLVIPLHLLSGLFGGVPIPFLASFYLTLAITCAFVWSLALLFGFVGSNRAGLAGQANTLAIGYTAFAFFILSPLYMVWNLGVTWYSLLVNFEEIDVSSDAIYWVWTNLSDNVLLGHSFTFINLLICLVITWRVLLRRFRRPLSPLLSRRQSYATTAYVIFITIGATLIPGEATRINSFSILDILDEAGLALVLSTAYFLALAMMASICPNRQALVEWSRTKSSGVMGYIWSDKSPAIVSFGLILLILNGLIIPWILSGIIDLPTVSTAVSTAKESPGPMSILLIVIGGTSTLFLIGCFMQFIMAQKLRNPSIWFGGCLLLWWVVPPIVLGILGMNPDKFFIAGGLWAFFGYPVGHLDNPEQIGSVVAGIFGQCCVTAFWLMSLRQSLQQLKSVGEASSASL